MKNTYDIRNPFNFNYERRDVGKRIQTHGAQHSVLYKSEIKLMNWQIKALHELSNGAINAQIMRYIIIIIINSVIAKTELKE